MENGKTIVFIHGMFMNPRSWEEWIRYFHELGYNCIAPAWPYHEGNPLYLRRTIPEKLGTLGLDDIVAKYEKIINALPEKPILIGHSVGGLVVQLLVNKGLAEMGICIASVAPNNMLDFDREKIKNALSLTAPEEGDKPIIMNAENFNKVFANTLSKEDALEGYKTYATHDSHNVFRDCLGKPGQIDMSKAHAPLLFITAEKDVICPPELNLKNTEGYTDPGSVANIKEFKNRSHFICVEPGWEEICEYISGWIEGNIAMKTAA